MIKFTAEWSKTSIIFLDVTVSLIEGLRETDLGRCELCDAKRSPRQLCSNMKNTSTFKSKHSNEVYQIKKNFNCNSKMVVYLIECRVCEKQYNGNIVTKFRANS